MRARSMARVHDPRMQAPPASFAPAPESPAIAEACERIRILNVNTWFVRQKNFADNLLTGRPVHMEPCRTIALSDDVRGALQHCEEILAGLGSRRSMIGSQVEVRGTMIALRWRRRFPDAVRKHRVRRLYGMNS